MRAGLVLSSLLLLTTVAYALQPPGGGPSQSLDSGGEVVMVTMGYSNLGNGIYGLEAEADFEAWVDPLDDPWDFRYGLTIHDTNSFEWARNSGSFSLNPGSQTTWSSDTFNGPSTSSSGVYNAVAGIEGRYTGAGEYDLLEFEAANVTIP